MGVLGDLLEPMGANCGAPIQSMQHLMECPLCPNENEGRPQRGHRWRNKASDVLLSKEALTRKEEVKTTKLLLYCIAQHSIDNMFRLDKKQGHKLVNIKR